MCEYYDEDGKANPRLLSQTQAALAGSVAFVDSTMTEYGAPPMWWDGAPASEGVWKKNDATHEFEDPFFALLTPILLDSYSSTR